MKCGGGSRFKQRISLNPLYYSDAKSGFIQRLVMRQASLFVYMNSSAFMQRRLFGKVPLIFLPLLVETPILLMPFMIERLIHQHQQRPYASGELKTGQYYEVVPFLCNDSLHFCVIVIRMTILIHFYLFHRVVYKTRLASQVVYRLPPNLTTVL